MTKTEKIFSEGRERGRKVFRSQHHNHKRDKGQQSVSVFNEIFIHV